MIDRIAQIFDFACFLPSTTLSKAVRKARQSDARDRAREVLEIIRKEFEQAGVDIPDSLADALGYPDDSIDVGKKDGEPDW